MINYIDTNTACKILENYTIHPIAPIYEKLEKPNGNGFEALKYIEIQNAIVNVSITKSDNAHIFVAKKNQENIKKQLSYFFNYICLVYDTSEYVLYHAASVRNNCLKDFQNGIQKNLIHKLFALSWENSKLLPQEAEENVYALYFPKITESKSNDGLSLYINSFRAPMLLNLSFCLSEKEINTLEVFQECCNKGQKIIFNGYMNSNNKFMCTSSGVIYK